MSHNHLVDGDYQSLCYTSSGNVYKAARRCEAEEIPGLSKGQHASVLYSKDREKYLMCRFERAARVYTVNPVPGRREMEG